MPIFRLNKEAFNIARSVKALLNLESVPRGAVADSRHHEKQAENPEDSRRHVSEQKKTERRDPPQGRIQTAHLRQLPDFIIIGAQRGGTTSLYRYLTKHPDVGAAFRKEVHFFDRYYEKGMEWYLAHYPVRGEVPVVGEASPSYLFHPDVPERAREAVPHAKFIVLLRNPVDRAYSQYQMQVRRGIQTLSFEDVIDKEPEWLSGSDDPSSLTWRRCSYVKRGLYVDQLERWMNVFPREQFLVIKSEDFYKDPEQILHQALAYLGLRPWSLTSFKAHHLGEYVDMDPATRKRLGEYFAPYNQQLYALLGRDLGWEHDRQ